MKLLIEVPDDFVAGACYDYTQGTLCPFASRGCWAGPKGFEKCPLKGATDVVACPHFRPLEVEGDRVDVTTCNLTKICGGVCNGGGGAIKL